MLTRQQNKISFMLLASRELESVKVSVRNSDILSLSSSIRAHCDITISTSGKSGVDTSAESSSSLFTVTASAISDVEGHDDSISFLQQRDTFTELFNDAHVLMTYKVSNKMDYVRVGSYQK